MQILHAFKTPLIVVSDLWDERIVSIGVAVSATLDISHPPSSLQFPVIVVIFDLAANGLYLLFFFKKSPSCVLAMASISTLSQRQT